MYYQLDNTPKSNQITQASCNKRSPYKVLLVEDDPFWQDLVSHTVKVQFGKHVSIRCARSFHQADNLVFNGHYDLVIFDQRLEGKETGLDLWESLREKKIYVPMIMLSSISQVEFGIKTNESTTKPMFLEKRTFRAKDFEKILDIYLQWPLNQKPVMRQLKRVFARAALVILTTIAFALPKILDRPNLTPNVGSVSLTPAINKGVDIHTDLNNSKVMANPDQFKRPTGKSTNRIKIENIFTPKLRSQIDRVVQRADEVKKIAVNSIAN